MCCADLNQPADLHPGVEHVSFCDACAVDFLDDAERDEHPEALENAYTIVAGLTWECNSCDAFFLLEESSAQLRAFTSGEPVHCPACESTSTMPAPGAICPDCSSELDSGSLICHVCCDDDACASH
jgi:hypothetical protein